ncbi:hypothetical protein [Mycobacterium sp. URHB0021]|jgi:hypothetical protein
MRDDNLALTSPSMRSITSGFRSVPTILAHPTATGNSSSAPPEKRKGTFALAAAVACTVVGAKLVTIRHSVHRCHSAINGTRMP